MGGKDDSRQMEILSLSFQCSLSHAIYSYLKVLSQSQDIIIAGMVVVGTSLLVAAFVGKEEAFHHHHHHQVDLPFLHDTDTLLLLLLLLSLLCNIHLLLRHLYHRVADHTAAADHTVAGVVAVVISECVVGLCMVFHLILGHSIQLYKHLLLKVLYILL
jgi:hypothetical protein